MGVYNLDEVHARPLKFYEPATFLENIRCLRLFEAQVRRFGGKSSRAGAAVGCATGCASTSCGRDASSPPGLNTHKKEYP